MNGPGRSLTPAQGVAAAIVLGGQHVAPTWSVTALAVALVIADAIIRHGRSRSLQR